MKILFAVNSESISEKIIKKYQKDYREILSYKNVYYFNAIIKEIQQDKSYDRIVISEDLEPFSNSNYESIDKFIFEKLDMISDEAHDSEGKEISIILICSDRHTKGSSFLVKLFGIGVYNAILGNDRRMEEICGLINKPRTKKEAKVYYKIDTDDVNYRAENEDEVDEMQIQNILTHFKKLGKNYDKYATSFENIASQYTDEQLKIIINCLPLNVKAILEQSSTKYQDIMSITGAMVKGVASKAAEIERAQQRTGLKIDIIENKLHQPKMTKPVVIPSSVKAVAKNKKTSNNSDTDTEESDETMKLRRERQLQAAKRKALQEKKIEQQRKEEKRRKLLEEQKRKKLEMIRKKKLLMQQREKQRLLLEKKKRAAELAQKNQEEENKIKTVKPERKIVEEMPQKIEIEESNTVENAPKRKRGRPRKNPPVIQETENKPKGKRGRPRKNPVVEEEIVEDDDIFENENFQNNQEEIELPELDEFEDDILDTENTFNEHEESKKEIENEELDEIEDEFQDDDIVEFEDDEDEDDGSEELLRALEEDEEDEEDDVDDIFGEDDEDIFATAEDDENEFKEEPQIIEKQTNSLESIEPKIDYSMSTLNSLMSKDKKIVSFVGASKNGVSFLVNNLAELFSSVGINTAILDMTKNRNSYYIYTKNEEALRKVAYTSFEKLQDGVADGIRVKDKLTVYTALPSDDKEYNQVESILSTLVQNHSLILIDCDFDTDPGYFASSQEIYLVQSLDILTIQPLTAFLKDLKRQNVLEQEKVRIVINKEVKVRKLTNKAIIGGMSVYNDPSMSLQTDLFNKDIVKYCSVPFEEMAYSKYLEGVMNCKISLNGYSKNFGSKLQILADMVYPLTSRQSYSSAGRRAQSRNMNQAGFSNNMNNTLSKMKKKY